IIGPMVSSKRSLKVKRFFDSVKIRIPIFGKIFKNIYIARMTRSLSTLIQGGVPIARSLEAVKEVVSNEIYKEVLTNTMRDVDEGTTVADSLALSKYIPDMVSQMINIGEETGKLDVVLTKLTDFYTREVDNQVANISVAIEPIIMIVLGVAIGGFVAAIIMPMWQLSSSF
ncbi:MAG: type II secretion system F family protein, partial [Patescibacteria group bacterium]